jgi:hypothetical protein
VGKPHPCRFREGSLTRADSTSIDSLEVMTGLALPYCITAVRPCVTLDRAVALSSYTPSRSRNFMMRSPLWVSVTRWRCHAGLGCAFTKPPPAGRSLVSAPDTERIASKRSSTVGATTREFAHFLGGAFVASKRPQSNLYTKVTSLKPCFVKHGHE